LIIASWSELWSASIRHPVVLGGANRRSKPTSTSIKPHVDVLIRGTRVELDNLTLATEATFAAAFFNHEKTISIVNTVDPQKIRIGRVDRLDDGGRSLSAMEKHYTL
jgi:hypothetical protein